MKDEIDLMENSIGNSKIHFILNTDLWESFDERIKRILHSVPMWDEVKFLDEKGNLNNDINRIPNDTGGIYLFVIKPNLIPNSHFYLMYIGRSHNTITRNLQKRIREYYGEVTVKKRAKIHRMIKGWGQYLYVRYIPLSDNAEIDKIETELINKILPPFNDKIPDKNISNAVRAFSI